MKTGDEFTLPDEGEGVAAFDHIYKGPNNLAPRNEFLGSDRSPRVLMGITESGLADYYRGSAMRPACVRYATESERRALLSEIKSFNDFRWEGYSTPSTYQSSRRISMSLQCKEEFGAEAFVATDTAIEFLLKTGDSFPFPPPAPAWAIAEWQGIEEGYFPHNTFLLETTQGLLELQPNGAISHRGPMAHGRRVACVSLTKALQ